MKDGEGVGESGVFEGSPSYFYTCSKQAKELFFYPLCAGYFLCRRGYETDRIRYDSFLVMAVEQGEGYVSNGGKEYPVRAGSFVLLDCFRPHRYGTRTGWKILWLHFDGILARRYFELCTKNGPVIRPENPDECAEQLEMILRQLSPEGKVREAEISCRITALLTQFMQAVTGDSSGAENEDCIGRARSYIAAHFQQPLTLEQLAEQASLSPYYFCRRFKKETGCTPHEYIIRARVDKAKYLLRTTGMPLKEIAFSCGFSNECSFSATFKKMSGCTPLSYRLGREE